MPPTKPITSLQARYLQLRMAFSEDDEDVGDFEDDDQTQGPINPSAGEAWTSKNDSGMVHRKAGTWKSFRKTVSVLELKK